MQGQLPICFGPAATAQMQMLMQGQQPQLMCYGPAVTAHMQMQMQMQMQQQPQLMSVGTQNFPPFLGGSRLQPTDLQPASIPCLPCSVADALMNLLKEKECHRCSVYSGTDSHGFQEGVVSQAGTPTLNHSIVNQDGSVDFKWTALSSDRSCEYPSYQS